MNIEDHLSQFLARHPDGRLRVGFSGGRDSTVLLATLVRLPQARARDLLAVHVNHGLHAEAAQWEAHAQAIAGQLGVPCQVDRVQVLERTEVGLEARARAARREAYSHHL
ncbi:MAG: tRNA(Ile)-lysidine synthetase, partial [Xanthomonadales bacterium]|nr:tRNA(Ile)-lysidine synthetase [Xanthomonadales bacterium]